MISIAYGFFCEDLRPEIGGKTTAVGLWGTGMVLAELPGLIRSLAFHALVVHPPDFTCPYELGLSGPFEPQITEPATGLLVAEPGKASTSINLIFGPVRFSREGTVVVHVRLLPEGEPVLEQKFALTVRGPRGPVPNT